MVMFSLDTGLLGKYNSSPRLWASLLLNGAEANALPVTVEAGAIENRRGFSTKCSTKFAACSRLMTRRTSLFISSTSKQL